MTSQLNPPPPPWDFKPIYDLFKALEPGSPTNLPPERESTPPPRVPSPSRFNPKLTAPEELGDFNRLYAFLGLRLESITRCRSSPRRNSIESSEGSVSEQAGSSQQSAQSTPPSSSPEDPGDATLQLNGYIDNRKVRWTDEVDGSDLTVVRLRSRTRDKASHKGSPIKNSADFDSETEPEYSHRPKPSISWGIPQPKPWVLPYLSNVYIDPTIIQPIDTLTIEEKRNKLAEKLIKKFGYGSTSNKEEISPLHIFVDCSNIVIGFYNALKIRRGMDVKTHTKRPPLSWEALATILERGRPVARRILVGSHNSHPQYDKPSKTPDYMIEARNFGYELNILDKVLKYKSLTPTKKKGRGNGYATTSGHSSGSDGTSRASKIVTEQAVDELLHMKILESIVDTQEPSTMILASGDAAEAEYSGGFLKNVERALMKGWKVELVAWSAGLSREYQSQSFLMKWKGKFTIIALDDFSEELLALYSYRLLPPVNTWNGFGLNDGGVV